ncbi:winged helix-turn-helix transcriptional regulator [Candidatus Woesearchaeota archaeon]|nr:winged helix-turn-helix transcriptional regulator [Candidatus Woesearchaeota archaeon]
MIFPKSEYKVLKLIYENPSITLSELIKRARVSAATAKRRLDHLLSSEIITEKKVIGGKRVLLRNFYPNLFSEEGKNTFSLIESEKKQEFFKKNKSLIGPFRQVLKNIKMAGKGKIKIVLVFGSFATYSQVKDSDLDILFLSSGEINKEDLKKEVERSFITFNYEISPRIDTLKNFKVNIDKGIYQTIVKNHIIIKGSLDFIRLIS